MPRYKIFLKEGIFQEATTTTLTTFLANVGTVLESCVDWTGSCAEMIMSHPILLVPTILGVGLIGLSIIKRFT